MLDKFVSRTKYDSYEDFIRNFSINIPDNFNYAFDVADELALSSPDKGALIWCDDKGNDASFTFGQLKYYSDKAASFLVPSG